MENKHKQFKCKDEVIFQNTVHFGEEKLIWNYGIVNYEDEEYVYLVGGLYINKKVFKILPYEGNEHLVGSNDEPVEEVKLEKGEWIFVATDVYDWAQKWSLIELDSIKHEQFCTGLVGWCYAVKFKDFNPNDMKETGKHILCVKNGRIVKYRD